MIEIGNHYIVRDGRIASDAQRRRGDDGTALFHADSVAESDVGRVFDAGMLRDAFDSTSWSDIAIVRQRDVFPRDAEGPPNDVSSSRKLSALFDNYRGHRSRDQLVTYVAFDRMIKRS